MKEIKAEGVDLFLSNGVYEELRKRFNEYHEGLIVDEEIATYLSGKVMDLFNESEMFKKYIEIYSGMLELKGFAMLEAEGDNLANFDEGFLDGKRIRRVQRWIDQHDGKYACLFLCVSGISEKLVESAKSLLFIPDYGISDNAFYLVSPLHDELIDMYTIDYFSKEIERLKGLPFEEAKKNIKERRLEEWLEVNGLAEE